MTATAVTGIGGGSTGQYTIKELAILANGPNIILSGRVDLAEDMMINPPSPNATVTLSNPLPGDNYTILTTGLNTSGMYVATITTNDGNLSSFKVIADNEGTCMYMIINNGIRPTFGESR